MSGAGGKDLLYALCVASVRGRRSGSANFMVCDSVTGSIAVGARISSSRYLSLWPVGLQVAAAPMSSVVLVALVRARHRPHPHTAHEALFTPGDFSEIGCSA